jgi:iron(III) transport system ATP-binding protein
VNGLRATGIRKRFGPVEVLHGVDLEVAAGGLTAVLGPSGCGKTTLLRVIAGFERADAGTVAFGDDVVCGPGLHVPARQRRVGYVAQEGALFPHLDVAANVAFGLPRRDRRAGGRVDELLDLLGIDASLRRRFPHELSGGQQQRVAVARALAPSPTLVLLDEPFASLDAGLRQGTGRAVADALRAAGATAVLVTHDQTEALSLAGQVAVMREGRIVQADTPDRIYRAPADIGVATFVGGAVLLPATVADGVARCVLGVLDARDAAASGPIDVLVRPEQLELRPTDASTGVIARVQDVSFFGHDADVRLLLADDGTQVLARVHGAEVPRPGEDVRVAVRGAVTAYAPAS